MPTAVPGYTGREWGKCLGSGKQEFPVSQKQTPQRMAAHFILEFLCTLSETGEVLFVCLFSKMLQESANYWCNISSCFQIEYIFRLQVMLLETSRRYNPEIESITFLKDLSYNRDDFAKAGGALDRCFFLPSVLCSYTFSFLMWAAGSSLWWEV